VNLSIPTYKILKWVFYWNVFDELTDFSAQEQDKRFLIWGPACLWTESHHHKRCFQISTSSNQNKAIPKTRRCPYIVYGTGRSQFYAIRDSALIDKKKPKENSKRCAQTVTNINNKEKTYFVKFFFSFLLWPAHKSHTQPAPLDWIEMIPSYPGKETLGDTDDVWSKWGIGTGVGQGNGILNLNPHRNWSQTPTLNYETLSAFKKRRKLRREEKVVQ